MENKGFLWKKYGVLFKLLGRWNLEPDGKITVQFSSLSWQLKAGKNHRTKWHVSVFLKHDGNMELYVSVTFTCCGNVKIQVYVIMSRFRHVSGTEMPIHVSVMFMWADFYCCLFPLRFCKRISAVVCFRYVSANGFPLLFAPVTFLQTDFQCVCCILELGKCRKRELGEVNYMGLNNLRVSQEIVYK